MLAASSSTVSNSKIDYNNLMRLKIMVLLFGLMALYESCCPFLKEENLGNNFYLSEYDNVDRRILYSEESCSNSGMEIVPMTVTEYAYTQTGLLRNLLHQDKEQKINNGLLTKVSK